MASVASTPHGNVADWTAHAACRGRTELFFSGSHFRQRLAVEVCRSCPVRAQCLADAQAHEGIEFHFGVVAGLTPAERAHWGR